MSTEVLVFVAGFLAKSLAGIIIGAGMRKGLSYTEKEAQLIMHNEREEQINAHVQMEHNVSYKYCTLDQCAV